MSIGFLFPGSKMNIQCFKELKLEILTEVSVYGKKIKILHDTNQCWRLKRIQVTLNERHIPPMQMRFSSYIPLTVTLLRSQQSVHRITEEHDLYSFPCWTEFMWLAEKFWEFTAFRKCMNHHLWEDTQHTPIQYGIHTTAARWNMLDRYYINWTLFKTIYFSHSTRTAAIRRGSIFQHGRASFILNCHYVLQ